MPKEQDKHSISPIIIKQPLPPAGIICSHPARAKRLSKQLNNVCIHTDYRHTTVYIGEHNGKTFFIASCDMGSGGFSVSCIEMILHGAQF